jgi:cupredoxin-like protein
MIAARYASVVVTGLALWPGFAPAAFADEPAKVTVTLKDHRFSPAEPTAPAGKPIVLEIVNQDQTPAEFESKVFRVEKIIVGGASVSVNLRPLKPGRYRFFDDYHEATTEGFLVVQ